MLRKLIREVGVTWGMLTLGGWVPSCSTSARHTTERGSAKQNEAECYSPAERTSS
jgi:hypothetical protein